MYPTLWSPPVFGVMNTSICQGSQSGSPTKLSCIGEPGRPVLSPLRSTEWCKKFKTREPLALILLAYWLNDCPAVASPCAWASGSIALNRFGNPYLQNALSSSSGRSRGHFCTAHSLGGGGCHSHPSPFVDTARRHD